MRGKDHATRSSKLILSGSPPLARERRHRARYEKRRRRITPACAGKTSRAVAREWADEDHPRLRGKDCILARGIIPQVGSPPLARERRNLSRRLCLMSGITPACAGKTWRIYGHRVFSWDHPRLRGKDPLTSISTRCFSGSPPLARERQTTLPRHGQGRRITPACAGKTIARYLRTIANEDHPRLRGKDRKFELPNETGAGSPPLARERLIANAVRYMPTGITPACAGKTVKIRHRIDIS